MRRVRVGFELLAGAVELLHLVVHGVDMLSDGELVIGVVLAATAGVAQLFSP
jgi:hypothetical protein